MKVELPWRHGGLAGIPRLCLGEYPTPVEPAPELARQAGIDELWLKRDDRCARPFGGNKVRRLELYLGAALARQARGVWSYGSEGSNHLVATALYARQVGLEAWLRQYPQAPSEPARRNAQRMRVAATSVRRAGYATLPFEVLWRRLCSRGARGLYYVPAGGSSPLGALGYVNAALELAQQIEDGVCPVPDAVVMPVGSGGTLAGLVVGLQLADLAVPVIGVRVVDRLVVNGFLLNRLIRGTARLLRRYGVDVRLRRPGRRYSLDHSQFAPGYGRWQPASEQAVGVAAAAGLRLEPIYSGKAMAATLARAHDWVGSGGRLLFILTANSWDFGP